MTAVLERFAVETPVGDLHALRARPDGEQRGIALIVPGFTGRADDYIDVQTDAAAHGWQTVAFSQRGQRGSAAPAGEANYTLPELAGEVVRVAEAIGGGGLVHVVGHSLGGLVAREAVVAHPDGFASLTMFCSGPAGRPQSHAGEAELVRAQGSAAIWHRDHPRGVLSPQDELDRERFAETSVDNIVAGVQILREAADITPAVVATQVPVLVLHGDSDDVWPIADQYDMAVRLGAEYRVIPDAGHLPNVDNPAVTARFLSEFWAEF